MTLTFLRDSLMGPGNCCRLAHRRVAWTARRGWLPGAQFDEVTDEIEEDLEERVETSETIDSGEEADEVVDCARDERRAEVGKYSRVVALLAEASGHRSIAVRAIHEFWICAITEQIEPLR
jgi:hypothetical protein